MIKIPTHLSKPSKKVLIGLAGFVVFVGVVLSALPAMVDTEAYKQRLIEIVKTSLGEQLEIAGDTQVTLFPAPTLIFSDLRFLEGEDAYIPEFRASHMAVIIGWDAIFSDTATIQEVQLTNPVIQAQTDKEGIVHWGWLKAYMQASTDNATPLIPRIQISGGSLSYLDLTRKTNIHLEDVQMQLAMGDQNTPIQADGSFNYNQQPISFAITDGKKTGSTVKYHFSHQAGSTLIFDGARKEGHAVSGVLSADIKDLTHLAGTPSSMTNNTSQQPVDAPLPFTIKFSGEMDMNEQHIFLHRTDVAFGEDTGTMGFYLAWGDFPTIAIELNTRTMKLMPVIAQLTPYFISDAYLLKQQTALETENPIPMSTNIYLLLDVDKAEYAGQIYSNLGLSAEADNGEIIIHHGLAHMAGDSTLDVQGKVSQGLNGLRFSGTSLLAGKSFQKWLMTYENSAIQLPADDFAQFNIAGSVFVSREQLRLSEATFNIGNISLSGGFATYFEARPRVEAEIKLKDANFDYVRDVWRRAKQDKHQNGFKLFTTSGKEFDWLKRLEAIIDLRLILENFRFLDKNGEIATVRLYMTPGELSLHGLRMLYKDSGLTGNLRFNVNGQRPILDIAINSNNFNTDYLDPQDGKESEPLMDLGKPPDKRWSKELFDFSWMALFDGNFDITIGKLWHKEELYENFKCKVKLENRSLVFEKLAFSLLNGNLEFAGTLIGGKVPGISASFGLYNVDLGTILRDHFDIDKVTGSTSISGVIATSGINFQSWVNQGEIKMVMAARGVRVRGFNLQGVLDTAQAARSTEDIVNGINTLIFDGITDFSVDGNLNIQGGVLKTPGVALKHGNIIGSLIGEIVLLDSTINLVSMLQFPELSSETIPTLTLNLRGLLNDYKINIDTSSLEAYVAKRIVGN